MSRLCPHACFLFVLIAACSSFATAQITSTAPLCCTDEVREQSGTLQLAVQRGGMPEPRATIELMDARTGMAIGHVSTVRDGIYTVTDLPAGEMELVVSAGVDQLRQRVNVAGLETLTVSLPAERPAPGNATTVSLAQLAIPEDARESLDKARAALGKRKMGDVQKHLAEALEKAPDFAEALTLRAVLEVDAGNQQQAITDLDRALAWDPNYGLAHVVLASVRNQQGQYDAALKHIQNAERIAPMWQSRFEAAKAMYGKREYERALRAFEVTQASAPKEFTGVHLWKAKTLLALKLQDAALAELRSFVDKSPEGREREQVRGWMQRLDAERQR